LFSVLSNWNGLRDLDAAAKQLRPVVQLVTPEGALNFKVARSPAGQGETLFRK